MKLHKNLIEGIENALRETLFEENRYADKVIERTLKQNRKWGSRDRAFVSETFYEILRWRKKIEFWMGEPFTSEKINKAIFVYLMSINFPGLDYKLFEGANYKKTKINLKKEIPTLSAKLSYEDWMIERLKEELPSHYIEELKALNIPAKSVLRANTLKTDKVRLQNDLEDLKISSEMDDNYKDALILTYKPNVFKTELFKDGMFEMQDANSQLVAEFVAPKPGMRVIDACAGAGGKTLHLAALMENKGQIIGMDIYDWKLEELKKRTRRAGVHNVQPKLVKDNKDIKRLYGTADRVLIDAPCSGLGVLKRNPDAKWKLTPEFIDRVIKEQKNILDNYCKLVKKGGELIYVTCSILPSENQLQVKEFLNTHPNFKLTDEKMLFPSETGYDGFYMAKLQLINS